jgi:hypothetical protein
LDAIAVLIVLLDDPSQLHVDEILMLYTIMLVGPPVFLYVTNCSFVWLLMAWLDIMALINLSFITVCHVSLPYPLVLMNGMWCLRLIGHDASL